MKTEAWREFAGDVKTTTRRLKKASTAYIKAHPLVVLGGGAVLGALVMAQFRRRPSVVQNVPRTGILGYLNTARIWLGRAVALASEANDMIHQGETKAEAAVCRH